MRAGVYDSNTIYEYIIVPSYRFTIVSHPVYLVSHSFKAWFPFITSARNLNKPRNFNFHSLHFFGARESGIRYFLTSSRILKACAQRCWMKTTLKGRFRFWSISFWIFNILTTIRKKLNQNHVKDGTFSIL